jgi:hypothetical protein
MLGPAQSFRLLGAKGRCDGSVRPGQPPFRRFVNGPASRCRTKPSIEPATPSNFPAIPSRKKIWLCFVVRDLLASAGREDLRSLTIDVLPGSTSAEDEFAIEQHSGFGHLAIINIFLYHPIDEIDINKGLGPFDDRPGPYPRSSVATARSGSDPFSRRLGRSPQSFVAQPSGRAQILLANRQPMGERYAGRRLPMTQRSCGQAGCHCSAPVMS